MIFGLFTHNDPVALYLLKNIAEKNKKFALPLFDINSVHRRAEYKGEAGMLHVFKIDVKLPPLYAVALIPLFIGLFFHHAWLFIVGWFMSFSLFFWTKLPYYFAAKATLRKSGYRARIKYLCGESIAKIILFSKATHGAK